MPTIHTCVCGVKVRLPEGAGGRGLRCPKCAADIVPAGVVAPAVATGTGVGLGVTCPICQTGLTDADAIRRCPTCEQSHHQDCWDEVGGCSTYGCEHAPEPDKPRDRRPLTAWGDTKICPRCKEEIKSIALRCRYCDARFETVDPLTPREYRESLRVAREAHALKVWLIVCLFAVPCSFPLTLVLALAYFRPRRTLLAKAGPVYPALANAIAVFSAVLCVMAVAVVALDR